MHDTSKEEEEEEEDFIHIFVSPSHNKKFELQFSSTSHDNEAQLFPADDFFYKGKLPQTSIAPTFHVPPNLSFEKEECRNQTPLKSCDISPSDSCGVSCEINPAEYFHQWYKKLSQVKQCVLTQKLKSSKAYVMSLFMKNPLGQGENHHKASSFTMRSILESGMDDHRKSFSEAIKRHCISKCYSYSASSPSTTSSASTSNGSSSSFSLSRESSNGFYEISLSKKSISGNYEVENSIAGAIAYCNQSHQLNKTK